MRGLAIALVLAAASAPAGAANLVALYDFNNSLASSIAGASALSVTDPLGQSSFVNDNVYGDTRTVYHVGGTAANDQQGGLTFSNAGGLLPSDSYSIAMVLKFDSKDGAWRRIVDVQDRTSDAGFYVDPSNHLDVYPITGSNLPFTSGAYRNAALTVASDGTVDGYLDGTLAFTTNTNVMNINNPANVVHFFLDNTQAGGQGEWSAGSVARISLYSGVLTGDEVAAINLGPLLPVPEPGEWAMMVGGLGLVSAFARRAKRASAKR